MERGQPGGGEGDRVLLDRGHTVLRDPEASVAAPLRNREKSPAWLGRAVELKTWEWGWGQVIKDLEITGKILGFILGATIAGFSALKGKWRKHFYEGGYNLGGEGGGGNSRGQSLHETDKEGTECEPVSSYWVPDSGSCPLSGAQRVWPFMQYQKYWLGTSAAQGSPWDRQHPARAGGYYLLAGVGHCIHRRANSWVKQVLGRKESRINGKKVPEWVGVGD